MRSLRSLSSLIIFIKRVCKMYAMRSAENKKDLHSKVYDFVTLQWYKSYLAP